jgi:hypothetical protein
MDTLSMVVIESWLAEFRRSKGYIDGALKQLSEEQFFRRPTPGTNSVALIVKHLAGNMRSRWTDFLTSDGEKPDRDRDGEFEIRANDKRESLTARLEEGWRLVFAAVEGLGERDLLGSVAIRGERLSVPDAVSRQVAHYGYHAGQILLIARLLHGDEGWNWQTVAPGGSRAFNQAMAKKHGDWTR